MDKTYTRKDFFKKAFQKAGESVVSVMDGYKTVADTVRSTVAQQKPGTATQHPSFVRPPGALPESQFLKTCTQCDDCIKACPHWVIRKAGPELGSKLAGTPILLPSQTPCVMCEDFPCIRDCKPKALVWPKNLETIKIGLAVVNEEKCYMTQGQPCDYCMVRCPVKPKAILALQPGQAAQVNAETCTGCGKCAQICPTKAIDIKSLAEQAVS